MSSYFKINNIGTFYPTGAIHIYPNTITEKYSIPGWLYCDGSAYSRTTYIDLFNVIGTTYGAGDGTTTFNIPDFRGYFAQGNPISYLTTIISTEINDKYLNNNHLPPHTHSGTTDAAGAHTHTFQTAAQRTNDARAGQSASYLNFWAGGADNVTITTEESAGFAHTHSTDTTSSAYGNGSGSNMLNLNPPHITMLFLIKY